MATISTRIDDSLKKDAEQIAEDIGIPLATAINIFLRRFISDEGFPFQVTANTKKTSIIDDDILDAAIKKAIFTSNDTIIPHQFTYLDPKSKNYIKVNGKE